VDGDPGDDAGAGAAAAGLGDERELFGVDHPASKVVDFGGRGVLAMNEAALGPEHPAVARDVNNLAGVLRDLGDLVGARASYERALAIAQPAYGPDHPTTRTIAANLRSLDASHGDGLEPTPW
jgi:hypothetical protein